MKDALDEKTLQSTKQNHQMIIVAGVGAPVAVGAVGVETARKLAKSGGGLPNKIPNMM